MARKINSNSKKFHKQVWLRWEILAATVMVLFGIVGLFSGMELGNQFIHYHYDLCDKPYYTYYDNKPHTVGHDDGIIFCWKVGGNIPFDLEPVPQPTILVMLGYLFILLMCVLILSWVGYGFYHIIRIEKYGVI